MYYETNTDNLKTLTEKKYFQDVLVAVEHFWPTLAIVKIGQVRLQIWFFWTNIVKVFIQTLLYEEGRLI